jgi:outer membrane protein
MFPKFRAAGAALALSFAAAAPAAHAETPSRWFVHAGPAVVMPAESAEMSAGGMPVPGANVSIDPRWTVEGEVGRYITNNIAIALAAGYPPTFQVNAAGTIAALGEAGKMTGGPAGLMVQYHFNREGRIQPYVGAGLSFLIVFSTKDGAMNHLRAGSAVGEAVQVGADFMVNDHWGAFVDLKKAWVGTVAKGELGPMPIRAKVKVNPLVPNFGVTYHF